MKIYLTSDPVVVGDLRFSDWRAMADRDRPLHRTHEDNTTRVNTCVAEVDVDTDTGKITVTNSPRSRMSVK